MSDTSFELPKENEKLGYKFILDSLRQRQRDESPTPPVEVATTPPPAPPSLEIPDIQSDSVVPMRPLELAAGKKYFRIGEVSEILGVEPYVLRYWEGEFPMVRPTKSKSGQRVYARRDVETLHLIEHLLHVERFSIKGARQKLQERRKQQKNLQDPAMQKSKDLLKEMAQQLREIIQVARGNPGLDV